MRPRNYWTRGGCRAMALAIKKSLPNKNGKMMDLVEPEDQPPAALLYSGMVHHVFVVWEGMFLDGDGAHQPEEMMSKWTSEAKKNGVKELRIEPHNPKRATDLKLDGSAATVREASHVVGWIINEALSEYEKSTK